MVLYLGLLLFSFVLAGISFIPFIDLLYTLHFTHHPTSTSPGKAGTPIGGGVLIIFIVTLLYALLFPAFSRFGVYVTTVFPLMDELNVVFFTFISFGLVGLYDDLVKIFRLTSISSGYRIKNLLLIGLSFICSFLLYQNLGIKIINLPFWNVINFGWGFIPLSAIIIYGFTRSFDITDHLDGLASGSLLICLLAFWGVALGQLDTVLSIFLALWIGAILAFMYFNVYPARIWLGNAGSLAFGASLAITGLLLGRTVVLLVIGSLFVIQGLSRLGQYLYVSFTHHHFTSQPPLLEWLLRHGWPEPKIVFRLWLFTIVASFFGLWLSQL